MLVSHETVSKSKFKSRALEYFRLVEGSGKEIVITDRGRPVARVVPFTPLHDEALVRLRGSVLVYLDPTEPVAVDDWETLDSKKGLP